MARDLTPLSATDLKKLPGFKTVTRVSTKIPDRTVSRAVFRRRQKAWAKSLKAPKAPKNPQSKVRLQKLDRKTLQRLSAIHGSDQGPAELVSGQKMNLDQLYSSVASSLTTHQYLEMQGERARRLRKASTGAEKAKVAREWAKVQDAAVTFSARGGLRVKPADLDSAANLLKANKADLNTVLDIAKSGRREARTIAKLTTATSLTAVLVPVVELAPLVPGGSVVTPVSLCDKPIAEGKWTKHFERSFALKVKLRVWCPSWANPFKTCLKTFTVAGASFSLNLEVGYRVTCCGATAWGQASAQACATVIGIKVCATCTAKVTAVAGFDRTSSGSKCNYGLGLVADLKCTLAGVTLFHVSAPFGYTITGPCPPPGFCK